jgi:3-methyladenine DNA glycosylase/8-oxoguanine DNA glycosylase
VDFARTIVSHRVAELLPNRVDLSARTLVRITERGKKLRIEGSADPKLKKTVAHMFRLDEDLSRFYELLREDELAWCVLGPGACCAHRPFSRTS